MSIILTITSRKIDIFPVLPVIYHNNKYTMTSRDVMSIKLWTTSLNDIKLGDTTLKVKPGGRGAYHDLTPEQFIKIASMNDIMSSCMSSIYLTLQYLISETNVSTLEFFIDTVVKEGLISRNQFRLTKHLDIAFQNKDNSMWKYICDTVVSKPILFIKVFCCFAENSKNDDQLDTFVSACQYFLQPEIYVQLFNYITYIRDCISRHILEFNYKILKYFLSSCEEFDTKFDLTAPIMVAISISRFEFADLLLQYSSSNQFDDYACSRILNLEQVMFVHNLYCEDRIDIPIDAMVELFVVNYQRCNLPTIIYLSIVFPTVFRTYNEHDEMSHYMLKEIDNDNEELVNMFD